MIGHRHDPGRRDRCHRCSLSSSTSPGCHRDRCHRRRLSSSSSSPLCRKRRYNLSILDDGFYPSVNFNDLHANCKVTRINHHYAHHLSCWPIIKDPHKFSGFSLDGYGDHDVAWTVFKDRQVKDHGSKISHGSIGLSMSMLGAVMELKGDGLDIAGKVMSLQSYGNMDHVFYRFLQQFDMTDIDHIFLPTYYGHQWNRKLLFDDFYTVIT